jgi:hypothetical protein
MLVLSVLLAGTLTACQQTQPLQAQAQQQPPPGAETAVGASGSAGSGTASGAGPGSYYGGQTAGIASRQNMCAQSRRIMSASSTAERQALMEQAMPDVPPDMREQHLRMMREGCE